MIKQFWLVILSLFFLSVVTRALPFLVANYMGERFNRLGKYLPAYIMMLLVVYEINPATMHTYPYAIPALLSLTLLTLVHLWRRNSLISLMVGTFSYITLLSLFR